MAQRKRHRLKVKNIVVAVLILLIAIAGLTAGIVALTSRGGDSSQSSTNDSTSSSSSSESSDDSDSSDSSLSSISDPDDEWQLILVNKTHPMPDDFNVELTDITASAYPDIPALDNMAVDSRIVSALQEMFRAAKADGQELFLRASYRTVALQQTYYDWHMQHYQEQGMTEEEAKAATLEYLAYPGQSEHHTGLACDIISVDWQNSGKEIVESFEETSEAQWLKENAHKYGFIMRYPKDKEDITQYGYEPWHFRYVGKAHAQEIYEQGICLEEYLGETD